MTNKIDHIAVGATSLERGQTELKQTLGVEIPKGGKHEFMATHNCVAQVGNSSFIEILAIDPEGKAITHPRWFTLDEPGTQARLAKASAPLCWVVGTDDLDGIIARSPIDLGEVKTFTRGERSWRLTVTPDGSLPEQGLIPAFIEWSPGPHPSEGMQNLGLTLKRVVLTHPDINKIKAYLEVLDVLHLADVVEGPEAALSFILTTADGRDVQLS